MLLLLGDELDRMAETDDSDNQDTETDFNTL